MAGSKVNDNPGACDYTWMTRTGHILKAGKREDEVDVCFLESSGDRETSLECYTAEEAIVLAADLLAWAVFINENPDLADKALARATARHNECSLLQRQAD